MLLDTPLAGNALSRRSSRVSRPPCRIIFKLPAPKSRALDIGEKSQTLLDAPKKDRQTFEIPPSGYGIHWPLLDEDLSIDGLRGIVHTPSRKAQSA